jgi:hypothetical protein
MRPVPMSLNERARLIALAVLLATVSTATTIGIAVALAQMF